MLEEYVVDAALDVPIYQQLVDRIRADIKSERLPYGMRLPTVRALAEEMDLAIGTVKRAYDELENEKLIEKMQGRGTFVCYRALSSGSRKERAMSLIDGMLDELEELHFSAQELEIFLNLKLRERRQQQQNLKVALVIADTESLTQLQEQLRGLPGIDLYAYCLRDILLYPYQLVEDTQLIITDEASAQRPDWPDFDSDRVVRVVMRPAAETVRELVCLSRNAAVGILSSGELFAENLRRDLASYWDAAQDVPVCPLSGEAALRQFVEGKTALLIPRGYEKYTEQAVIACLHSFAESGALIECSYEADGGSALRIREKLAVLRKN